MTSLQKTKKRVRAGTVTMFMGAMIAYLIGSGFATGQESMQYFSSYGAAGAAGALVITLAFYVYFCTVVLRDASNLRLKSANDIFTYYCGKYIGGFFGVATPAFLYAMYAVMLSGAGAVLNQQLGWNNQVGIFAMAIAALLTVMLGLDGLVAVVSKVGPIIVALALIVGTAGIIMKPQGIAESAETLPNIEVLQAAPNWAISGFIFPALGLLMLVPFLAGLALIHRSAVGPDGFRGRSRILVSGMADRRPRCRWCSTGCPDRAVSGWRVGFLCRGGRCVDGVEELFPRGFPGPGFGQVKADASGAAGDAGRDVDEFAADRAGAGLAEGPCGEESGGPGEVVGHDRGNQPGRVRGENT